jgi:DNA-binding transcriptional MocR family regulator
MVTEPLLFEIDRGSRLSIKKQIINAIRNYIDRGLIKSEAALPSTRGLAVTLAVSRYTVCQAYEELQILGYLKSRPGSYNIVQNRRREAEYNPKRPSLIDWAKISNHAAEGVFRNYQSNLADISSRSDIADASVINLSELQLDPDLFPQTTFRKCISRVISQNGSRALDFCPPAGNIDLREYVAKRLRLHEISTSAKEVLITHGSQQALDLVIRLLARPGAKAVVEAPTYFNMLPILRLNGMSIETVPMRSDGLDIPYLENVLRTNDVSFLYTMPTFQNPTGNTTTHEHREWLLNLCVRHKVPILEDGFEEEMKYFGTVPPPIKSIDDQNVVIYTGTFSKVLVPGVRIGWIIAHEDAINRLTAIKRASDLRCSNLVQSALNVFCREGYYDIHLRKAHNVFRKRMALAMKLMEECFPDSVSWARPSGGYTIWVKMPVTMSAMELHDHMAKHGVIVSPGVYYFPQQTKSKYFRLSISRTGDRQVQEGLIRLGKALHELCRRPAIERESASNPERLTGKDA